MPKRSIPALSIVALLAALLGGCPNPSTQSVIPGGTGGPSTSTAGSSNTGGGGSATQTAFEQELAERFPSCESPAQEDSWAAEILARVNAERAAEGLDPVIWNDTLAQQATQYACEMIHWDFFDHVNPVTGSTLGDRADEFGYDYSIIGENLAAGQVTPEQAMRDWMDSPGHRANILEPRFTELGIGVRVGGSYGTYWVQEFGRPGLSKP